MAFVCTFSAAHMSFDVVSEGSATSVFIPIGYDDQADISYFASIGIDVLAGGMSELFFHVVEQSHETGAARTYWCGKDTTFIVGHDRALVLDAICAGAQLLVDVGTPEMIEVTTYDENPPEHALIKHFRVMSVFESNGYTISTFEPYHGKRLWKLKR
jgi:hypothetical protein